MNRHRHRVGRAVVAALAVAALPVVFPRTVAADPINDQKAVVAKVTDHLQALERQSDALAEDYDAAIAEKQQLDGQVAASAQRVTAQQAAVEALRRQLAEVAVQAYMGAANGGVSPIFDTTAGVTDGLARDHLARVATNSGTATTDQYEQALRDLRDEQAGLRQARSRAAAQASQLDADKRETEQQAATYTKARAD